MAKSRSEATGKTKSEVPSEKTVIPLVSPDITPLEDVPVEEISVAVRPSPDERRPVPPEPASEPRTEKEELARLEKVFADGHRDAIAALRDIREKRLFKSAGYDTFDDYMARRWGKTRQWATQEINWLRACELLQERTGKDTYQLSKESAAEFRRLIESPEELCHAYLRARKAAGNSADISKKIARGIVEEHSRYIGERDNQQKKQGADAPALTFGEFQFLEALGKDRQSAPNLVAQARERAKESEKSLPDCLAEVCQEKKALPTNEHLLNHFRGDALYKSAMPLVAMAYQWAAEEVAKKKAHNTLEELKTALMPTPPKPQVSRRQKMPPQSEAAASTFKCWRFHLDAWVWGYGDTPEEAWQGIYEDSDVLESIFSEMPEPEPMPDDN
jgi:hypothetical protein